MNTFIKAKGHHSWPQIEIMCANRAPGPTYSVSGVGLFAFSNKRIDLEAGSLYVHCASIIFCFGHFPQITSCNTILHYFYLWAFGQLVCPAEIHRKTSILLLTFSNQISLYSITLSNHLYNIFLKVLSSLSVSTWSITSGKSEPVSLAIYFDWIVDQKLR